MSYSIEKNEKGFLLFTIKRSEKRNAINYDVMEGLNKVINMTQKNDIKALVITGEGDRAFCSGGDLSVFHLLQTRDEAYPMLSKMANIIYKLLTLPIPTVALINGTMIGGGCELATACDFRLAKKGIKAGFVQGKQAITTGWGGGSILSEKLPANKALKLLMEAEIHKVEELRQIGYIDEVYETDSIKTCENYLERILTNDLKVIQSYKKMWIRKWEEGKLYERIEEEVRNCAILWESDAHHEHVQSFVSKKTLKKE